MLFSPTPEGTGGGADEGDSLEYQRKGKLKERLMNFSWSYQMEEWKSACCQLTSSTMIYQDQQGKLNLRHHSLRGGGVGGGGEGKEVV